METDKNVGSGGTTRKPRVLIVFYSFSGQTLSLISRLTLGMRKQGVEVVMEKLKPVTPLRFPIGTVPATIKKMVVTLFRQRVEIQPLSPAVQDDFDLIIVGGPTWSYNPSGPVLAMLDRDGKRLLAGKTVLPLISCRGYWRMHWYGLRAKLVKCGARIPNFLVFSHPHAEPWRTVGVFLKLAGKRPERSRFIGRYYKKFGHSKLQLGEALRLGREIGTALQQRTPLSSLTLRTDLSTP